MQDFSDAKTELWTLYSAAEKYAVQVHGQSQPTATKRIQKFTLLYCKSSRFISVFIIYLLYCTFNLISSYSKCFLYLRIVHFMLIIFVIAVRLHAHLNVDFYVRFTPGSLCLIKLLIKLSHRIIPPPPTFK